MRGDHLRLVDDRGRDVEHDELLVRGHSAAIGYLNRLERSRRTFEREWTRIDGQYIRRTDGVYIDVGRADDMFKVSGIWVSPF